MEIPVYTDCAWLEEGDGMNCDYCQGDSDGWVSFLPKQGEFNGNAVVIDDFFGAFLKINLPYKKELKYKIKFCPMCGRNLRGRVRE